MNRSSRFVSTLIAMSLLGSLGAGPGRAFSRDTHYYLTYIIALESCFDWREAHIIASANRRLDGQSATKAEPNILKTHAKTHWHAFGSDEIRLRDLWYRAVDEPEPDLRLVYLGQFLHYLQDMESHAGFPIGIGHATASFLGKDPDSWARDVQRTGGMVMATVDHLPRYCQAIGRPLDLTEDPDQYLIETRRFVEERGDVLEAVLEASSPRWKARQMGGFTKKGKKILRKNAVILEGYIEEYVKPVPGKGVPEDFKAGDPERGLPPALPLVYDQDGNVLNGDEVLAIAGERVDPDAIYGGNNQVSILKAKPVGDSWSVDVRVENIGNQSTKAGQIGVGVYDPLTEEILGEEIRSLAAISPGKDLEMEFAIPVSDPGEEVVIIAWLEVDDLEQINNEAWFIQAEDVEYIEEKLEQYEEERLAEEFEKDDLEFLGEPKAWVTDQDELCIVAWADLDDLDPTGFLEPARYWLEDDADGADIEVPLSTAVLFDGSEWNISVLGRTQRPAPKVWACFDIHQDLCTYEGPDIEHPSLKISLGTADVKIIESFDIDDALAEQILGVCDR